VIGKLLGMLTSFLTAVCVATVISAAVLIAFYAQSWKVTSERAGQAMAILQGRSLESLLPPSPPKKEADSEQPSLDQQLAAQSLKNRDLEQRERIARAYIQQFQEELDKIAAEHKRMQSARDDLQNKLDELKTDAVSAGMETATATITTLKPKQAKDLMKQQLDKGQTELVARMLANMSDGKRAKIIAEFKTTDELKQIGEVLDRIRKGRPTTELVDQTEKRIQPPNGPGT
jgi:hypothetical protein